MLAYCDPKSGDISLGKHKPRRAILIARHKSAERLRAAIIESGAHEHGASHLFAVPWFVVQNYAEDQRQCIKRFAEKVSNSLDAATV